MEVVGMATVVGMGIGYATALFTPAFTEAIMAKFWWSLFLVTDLSEAEGHFYGDVYHQRTS